MKCYDFQDYRGFIRAKIEEHGRLRGYLKKMAEAAGCQSSFLSHVLNRQVQMTPDHAAGLAVFWQLDAAESEFFVALVELERAGSSHLRRMLKARLAGLQTAARELDEHFRKPERLDDRAEQDYYSSWYFAAIHLLLTLPHFSSVVKIALTLRLPESLVQTTLTRLEEMGLVSHTSGTWRATATSIHLPRKSKLNLTNQAAWRQFLLARIQEGHPDEVHYSAVHTLSRKDCEEFRRLLVEGIDRTRALVAASPEEELVFFSCDFMRLS